MSKHDKYGYRSCVYQTKLNKCRVRSNLDDPCSWLTLWFIHPLDISCAFHHSLDAVAWPALGTLTPTCTEASWSSLENRLCALRSMVRLPNNPKYSFHDTDIRFISGFSRNQIVNVLIHPFDYIVFTAGNSRTSYWRLAWFRKCILCLRLLQQGRLEHW